MTKRIELAHNASYAELLYSKRDIYTLCGPVAFDFEVLKYGYDIIRDGNVGFLSISSPVAHMEICKWRGRQAIIWDARWLEFVTALCRLTVPGLIVDLSQRPSFTWDRTAALEDLVTLFLIEQLSILDDTEVGLALALKRVLVSKGLTATAVLNISPPLPDVQLRRHYKDLLRFAEDSVRHLTLIHEWIHLGFRWGVIRHDEIFEPMKRSMEDYVGTVRRAGEKYLLNFRNEMRQREAEILDNMCASLLRDGMSGVSIEEMHCDVYAATLYAREYVAPRVIRHNDIALFRYGCWVVLNYLAAFYLFEKIAFLATTIISRKGWYDSAFSGPARARDGITKHVYRCAVGDVVKQCTFSTGAQRDVENDIRDLEGWFARLELANYEWFSAFVFDQRWAAWTARASDEVSVAGGIAAARAEVWRYLGWRS